MIGFLNLYLYIIKITVLTIEKEELRLYNYRVAQDVCLNEINLLKVFVNEINLSYSEDIFFSFQNMRLNALATFFQKFLI